MYVCILISMLCCSKFGYCRYVDTTGRFLFVHSVTLLFIVMVTLLLCLSCHGDEEPCLVFNMHICLSHY